MTQFVQNNVWIRDFLSGDSMVLSRSQQSSESPTHFRFESNWTILKITERKKFFLFLAKHLAKVGCRPFQIYKILYGIYKKFSGSLIVTRLVTRIQIIKLFTSESNSIILSNFSFFHLHFGKNIRVYQI